MSPVVRKSLNIAIHIHRPKLLFPFISSKDFFQIVGKFGPTVPQCVNHWAMGLAGAFGPAERRCARKLVIISQFQTSIVIQTKK